MEGYFDEVATARQRLRSPSARRPGHHRDWGVHRGGQSAWGAHSCPRVPDRLGSRGKAFVGCGGHARQAKPACDGCHPPRQGVTEVAGLGHISIASCLESWLSRRQSRSHAAGPPRGCNDVTAFVKLHGYRLAGPGHRAAARLRKGRGCISGSPAGEQRDAQDPQPRHSVAGELFQVCSTGGHATLAHHRSEPSTRPFISRQSTDARQERRAVSAARTRHLMRSTKPPCRPLAANRARARHPRPPPADARG